MGDQETKSCRQCATDIRRDANYCTVCKSFQNWRRYLTVSGTVLPLLIALITVSTPFVQAFDRPHSNLSITQATGQFETNEEGQPQKSYGLYATISNLGDKPALIAGIERIKLADGFELQLSLKFEDTFHESGTKRVKFSTLYLFDGMLDIAMPEGFDQDSAFQEQFYEREEPYKTNVLVEHFNGRIESIPIQFRSVDILQEFLLYADKCVELGEADKLGTLEDDGIRTYYIRDQSCEWIYRDSERYASE